MLLFLRDFTEAALPSVYKREKNPSTGHWRYRRVEIGKGIKTGMLTGPFFVRPFVNGKQIWSRLSATTLKEAKTEADKVEAALEAASRGFTVAEAEALTNSNRMPIRVAVDRYLELKRSKAPKTVMQYTRTLNEFVQSIRVRFLDEITTDVLRGYTRFMEDQGYAGKTIHTRINIVNFLLKKNGIAARLPKDEMPVVDEEPAVPYSEEELRKLFSAMDKITTGTTAKKANAEIVNGKAYTGPGFGQAARYKFFLGTAARDKEVTYAAWSDIDFDKKTYHIRGKKDVGFSLKNHESRVVPMPDSLIELLKLRKKNAPDPRWIFVNEDGKPDNHFLRKLKVIALHAGLNCGECKTTVTKGRYEKKREVEVSCKADPVCEHIYLHRFRKTCATRWEAHGVPIRTIQHYLGHKNLETTMIYLGIADSNSPRMRDSINRAYGE